MANISAIKLPNGVTYNIKDNSSGYITGMTTLSYGSSTWDNFIEAYNANKVVYCRASSNSNPASGSQTRLAFMAYVNNATAPTNVEFQYYRSVSSHTASQQGDQVYVYKLDKTNGWTVTVREASVKVVAGTGLGGTYSNGTMTLTGPTKVSDLTNDSGFITTETDPTVPSWAKQSTKPTYTALEVGALPDTTQIPSKTSDLNNDVPFATTDTATTSANGLMSSTDKSKLDGIESGAEVNYVTKITQHFIANPSDPQNVYPRSATLDYNAVGINDVELLTKSALGSFNGVCDLDASSKVPKSRLPSTSTPTADEVSEFDGDAHMNSTDMTTGSGSELEDFIDGLNVSGGGVVKESVTPTSGSNYSGYGNCYYEVIGKLVHFHIGIQGLTANTSVTIYTMPSGLRPPTTMVYKGGGGNSDSTSHLFANATGTITVNSPQQYAIGDIWYFAS